KFSLVDFGNAGFQHQMTLTHLPFRRIERNGSRDVQLIGGKAGFIEVEAQLHGEAACMGRRNQFLRIGTLRFLKTSLEGVWGIVKNSTLSRYTAGTFFSGSLPNGSRFSVDHNIVGLFAMSLILYN